MNQTIRMVKQNGVYASVLTAGVALSSNAFAALPTAASTAFTEVQTDGLALIDLAWPLAIALTSAVIVLGLFKKFAKKAAS
jgi:hypothetical protein